MDLIHYNLNKNKRQIDFSPRFLFRVEFTPIFNRLIRWWDARSGIHEWDKMREGHLANLLDSRLLILLLRFKYGRKVVDK